MAHCVRVTDLRLCNRFARAVNVTHLLLHSKMLQNDERRQELYKNAKDGSELGHFEGPSASFVVKIYKSH